MTKHSLEDGRTEFKREFDASNRSWLETIKDIVAMANSGGGQIFFGLDNEGQPTEGHVVTIDPADVTNKIAKYSSEQFSNFSIVKETTSGKTITCLEVRTSSIPIIFTSPGTYEADDSKGKQITVFGRGTIYFRHGAKSEPGTSNDLRIWEKTVADNAVQALKDNLRQVVELPTGHKARVISVSDEYHQPEKIRITNDSDAAVARIIDPFTTHPFRQKDLVTEFNTRMHGKVRISPHDVNCVRKTYHIDRRPDFFFKPAQKHFSPIYSDLFLRWLVDEYNKDPHFFENARKTLKCQLPQQINTGSVNITPLRRVGSESSHNVKDEKDTSL